jgi:hypothetical protein
MFHDRDCCTLAGVFQVRELLPNTTCFTLISSSSSRDELHDYRGALDGMAGAGGMGYIVLSGSVLLGTAF